MLHFPSTCFTAYHSSLLWLKEKIQKDRWEYPIAQVDSGSRNWISKDVVPPSPISSSRSSRTSFSPRSKSENMLLRWKVQYQRLLLQFSSVDFPEKVIAEKPYQTCLTRTRYNQPAIISFFASQLLHMIVHPPPSSSRVKKWRKESVSWPCLTIVTGRIGRFQVLK